MEGPFLDHFISIPLRKLVCMCVYVCVCLRMHTCIAKWKIHYAIKQIKEHLLDEIKLDFYIKRNLCECIHVETVEIEWETKPGDR